MGRKKVKFTFIENNTDRRVSYKKTKKGILNQGS
ncbi:hypothetical protein RDI58_001913 [Solanum bulbocastanum]|uniref:MADS-box domain-containing protein n=1 Tax=Solanum bulbocastanum TaxID=147425 RepID=A0AAN8U5X0_SOLBU